MTGEATRTHFLPTKVGTKEVAMVAGRLAECVRRGPAAGACGVRFYFKPIQTDLKKSSFF